MLFLISWLIALYFLAPSAVSCLPFFSALRSSHGSSMLVVTHGLLTALRLLISLELIKSNRDSVRKARETYLIERGQTAEPLGMNKKDEM